MTPCRGGISGTPAPRHTYRLHAHASLTYTALPQTHMPPSRAVLSPTDTHASLSRTAHAHYLVALSSSEPRRRARGVAIRPVGTSPGPQVVRAGGSSARNTEVPFGQVVKSPIDPFPPLSVVQPEEGCRVVACAEVRISYVEGHRSGTWVHKRVLARGRSQSRLRSACQGRQGVPSHPPSRRSTPNGQPPSQRHCPAPHRSRQPGGPPARGTAPAPITP